MNDLSNRLCGLLSLLLIATCLVVVSPCPAATQTPRYSVMPLGGPRSEFEWEDEDYVQPSRLNNRGDVLGYQAGVPVLYRDGALRPFWPADAGYVPYYMWINNRGTVTGYNFALDPDRSPAVMEFTYWTRGQKDFVLARASTFPEGGFEPWDMNEWGTIVGELRDTPLCRAVVYRDGEARLLPPLAPGAESYATAINNRGQIVGWSGTPNFSYPNFPSRAVLWSDGRVQDLGLLPGCANANATDINDGGEVIGSCDDMTEESGWRLTFVDGFIWKDGAMRKIPVPAGTWHCVPLRINNRGEVLIEYFPRMNSDTFGRGAWLYSAGALHDLDTTVADATGWRVTDLQLLDINGHGEIVAVVQYLDQRFNYWSQGILLQPR